MEEGDDSEISPDSIQDLVDAGKAKREASIPTVRRSGLHPFPRRILEKPISPPEPPPPPPPPPSVEAAIALFDTVAFAPPPEDEDEEEEYDDERATPAAHLDEYWQPLSVPLHEFLKTPRTILEIEAWGLGRPLKASGRREPRKFRTMNLLHQTLAWLSFKGLVQHVAPRWHQAAPTPPVKPEFSGYSSSSHTHLHSFGSDD